MLFSKAAAHFNREQAYDAYSGAALFLCKTQGMAAVLSAGQIDRRRTMTTAPGITLPARGIVQLSGLNWVMGSGNPDSFNSATVRYNYDLKKATGMLNSLSPGQACLASGGTPMWVSKQHAKDTVNPVTDSDYDSQWLIFCASAEGIDKGEFFTDGTTLFRVRNVYSTSQGYSVAETDEFDVDAAQSATFVTNGAYDGPSDTFTTTSTVVSVIQTDQSKFYEFRTEAEASRKPGDLTVFVAQSSITPVVSANFTMLGYTWRVEAVVSELDAWALHAKRA
jgi:hypothetical protein